MRYVAKNLLMVRAVVLDKPGKSNLALSTEYMTGVRCGAAVAAATSIAFQCRPSRPPEYEKGCLMAKLLGS
jgi:hypothetical protein